MARKPIRLDLSPLLGRPGAEEEFELDTLLIVDGDLMARVRDIRIHAVNHGDSIMVTGAFAATVGVECARCLTMFDTDLDVEIFEPIPTEVGIGRDQEALIEASDEYDSALVSQSVLDVGELVRQQVVMSIPMLPLCSETCEGLCTSCGRPARDCGCATAQPEEPEAPKTGFGRLLANALEAKDEG